MAERSMDFSAEFENKNSDYFLENSGNILNSTKKFDNFLEFSKIFMHFPLFFNFLKLSRET